MATNPQRDDMHGIHMTEEAFVRLIGVESPYRYELIDGIVLELHLFEEFAHLIQVDLRLLAKGKNKRFLPGVHLLDQFALRGIYTPR